MIRFCMVLIGVVGLAVAALVGAAATFGEAPRSPRVNQAASTRLHVPAPYPYIAADILEHCGPRKGIWVDLGSGSGGVGLALAATDNPAASASTIVLVDPNTEALSKGLRSVQSKGLAHRVVAVVGKAESMPLPDGSVDLVVSRGSDLLLG